jgi:NAD(P)-dependent dehydrogenase (short-subunit alcohol dehydrogenase family)
VELSESGVFMSHPEISRNVLVVIGTGGMGLAIARRLAAGRRLLLADYSDTSLEAAVSVLRGEGQLVEGHTVDVSDRGAVEKLAGAAGAAGHIDAVIHTAGVSPVMATSKQIYDVDLLGTAHIIDAFLIVATPGTSLVCIASMAGHFTSLPADLERHLATAPTDQLLQHEGIDPQAPPGRAYTMAKRGNQLRVQAAAHAWGGKGARLNTISPGVISTPMGAQELQGPTGAYIQSMVDLSGTRRMGTPDDIAAAAAFLVGPDSSFITGNDILVDGGAIAAQRWNRTPNR